MPVKIDIEAKLRVYLRGICEEYSDSDDSCEEEMMWKVNEERLEEMFRDIRKKDEKQGLQI